MYATPPSPVRLHKKINPETGQVENYNPISCALGQPVSRCAILHDVLHAVHKNPRCKARASAVWFNSFCSRDTPRALYLIDYLSLVDSLVATPLPCCACSIAISISYLARDITWDTGYDVYINAHHCSFVVSF